MAGVPQKTLNWLYDVLKREYRDPNRTYSDLAHVLSRYSGLGPRTDVYTFENGSSALLVHFQGTIPVIFRGNTYRFPISLWVPHSYPYDAPTIYVKPTDDMAVRPGQHVGGDGKIYHPYLAHWREAWERSNIIEFLSILSDVFAKEPPVVARVQQQQHRQSQPPPPPVPPLPSEIQPQVPSHFTAPHSQAGRASPGPPPPPPKDPSQGGRGPAPAHQDHSSQQPGRYDAPPPLPPQAQPVGQGQPHPQPAYGNGNIQRPLSGMNYMPQRTSSLRQSTPAQTPPSHDSQQQPQYRPHPPRPAEVEHRQYAQGQYQYQPPQGPGPGRPPPPQGYDQSWQRPPPGSQGHSERSASQNLAQGALPAMHYQQQQHQNQPQAVPQPQPQHPHYQYPQSQPQPPKPTPAVNLLDSPFDIPLPAPTAATTIPYNPSMPAPPIPVNPEREALLSALSHHLTQSLHNQIAQSTSALPALSSQNAALQTSLHNLSSELANLQTLHSTLSSNLSLLSTSLSKSDQVIDQAHARSAANDIPAVDDMLVPPTVVARQLYDAACEERGIEAGILALQEGFVRGRVGGDVWSRRTRELAREGFKRRWMERKVARGMGLDLSMLGNGV